MEVHDQVHAVLDQLQVKLLAQFGFLESMFVVHNINKKIELKKFKKYKSIMKH